MWSWLASFLAGPVIKGLIESYKLRLQAKTQSDTLAVDLATKEIEGEVAQRQIEASIIRQEEGRWWTACIRPLAALPFVIWIWKVVVWDKVLGWGVTDPLNGQIGEICTVVIAAYFGGRTIEKVARIFKRN